MIFPAAGSPSVAEAGRLVYLLGDQSVASGFVTVDRSGDVLHEWTLPEEGNYTFALSPDGTGVAMEIRGNFVDPDIWIFNLTRDSRTRFAFGPERQRNPAWSPDGRLVVYSANNKLWLRPADGASEARYIGEGKFPSFAPDGRHLLYSHNGATSDIWIRDITDLGDSTLLLGTAAEEFDPSLSPSGDYLLYSSDESGEQEVYLRDYPSGTGRWQVSTSGGTLPQWAPSGDKIYYTRDVEFLEVEVELEPQVRLGAPQVLFSRSDKGLQDWGLFVIRPLPEPDRFLTLKLAGSPQFVNIVVVDNWVQEFEKAR